MGKKILIVDDDVNARRLVRLNLEEDGYEIHEAENGREGFSKAKQVLPDLVILDLMMPDKWGYVVCDELKTDPATKGIPVMFLTSRSSHLSQKMGEIKGGDYYMTKPFQPAEIRKTVKKLLGLK